MIELSTVDDTRAFGRRLAAVLRAGDVVLRATSDELDDRDALLSKYLGQSDIVAAAATAATA